MNARKILFYCLLALSPLVLPAQELTVAQAADIAEQFFATHQESGRSRSFYNRNVSQVKMADAAVMPYVFGSGDGRFVMISRRLRANPILAYGTEGNFDNMALPVKSLFMALQRSKADFQPENVVPVAPLVKTVRSQEAPFNNHCPYYTGSNGVTSKERCLVGCVATALEQLLTYHRYPATLQDTLYGWHTQNYAVDTIPEGTPLCFDEILDEYHEGNYTAANAEAVSLLCYYSGIASHMNWGLNASGAKVQNLVGPLRKAFGYQYVRHLYSGDYIPEHFRELIYRELSAGRPILFAGYNTMVMGHAFVIDGINADGFYHVCWGYGGEYDGYYDLSVLNTYENPAYPMETGRWLGHYCLQETLFLNPDSVEWTDNDTISVYDNIRIDSVVYSRPPDCNGYTTIQMLIRNITDQNIYTDIELLTFEEGDSAAFSNGDFVAVTGTELHAGASKWVTAYCFFAESGKRVLGISNDDSTFLYLDTLTVEKYNGAGVTVANVDSIITETTATFNVRIVNNSDVGWAGNQITYSLFRGDYTTAEGDWRQWDILNLEPAGEKVDTVSFEGLIPGEQYTFIVRNPWLPVVNIPFTTHVATGIYAAEAKSETALPYYNMYGRKVGKNIGKGIYLVPRKGRYVKVKK